MITVDSMKPKYYFASVVVATSSIFNYQEMKALMLEPKLFSPLFLSLQNTQSMLFPSTCVIEDSPAEWVFLLCVRQSYTSVKIISMK